MYTVIIKHFGIGWVNNKRIENKDKVWAILEKGT